MIKHSKVFEGCIRRLLRLGSRLPAIASRLPAFGVPDGDTVAMASESGVYMWQYAHPYVRNWGALRWAHVKGRVSTDIGNMELWARG